MGKIKREKEYVIINNLEIIDAGSEGKAVGKWEGLTVFVPYVIPGDIVDVKIIKKKKGYAEAHLLNVVEASPDRVNPKCSHFGLCGGCKWQCMSYEKQLFYKQKQVSDNFRYIGKFDHPPLLPIIPAGKEYYYRNKLEFTFTDRRWLDDADMIKQESGEIETRGLGFHIPGKFDKILDIDHCYLQQDPSNEIRLAVKEYALKQNLSFYNTRAHHGFLRNLLIRTSSAGEQMVIVIFGEETPHIEPLMNFLKNRFPEISSLQYAVNTKLNDSINDLNVVLFSGLPFIKEKMDNLDFKIGPVSFYQTNSEQAYRLYQVARDFAEITLDDVVYDLYTGIGTIANFVANMAKKIIGIEYVDAAIRDAKENAMMNNIKNAQFFAGDMAKVLNSDFIRKNGRPDIVITDPPRAGMHPKVIAQLLETAPDRIVYISCNPATQARDIALLTEKYSVMKVQPVDMFPHTQHVENVTLLRIKSPEL